MLDPSGRLQSRPPKLQGGRPSVAPLNPPSQRRVGGRSCTEHFLSGDCVEGVGEVQLHQHLVGGPGMAGTATPTWPTWAGKSASLASRTCQSAPKHFPNGDGTDSSSCRSEQLLKEDRVVGLRILVELLLTDRRKPRRGIQNHPEVWKKLFQLSQVDILPLKLLIGTCFLAR